MKNSRTFREDLEEFPDKSRAPIRHELRCEPCYNERMPGNEAMMPASPGVKLTYDDFLLFPDDGQRHELIRGELRTMAPSSGHRISTPIH